MSRRTALQALHKQCARGMRSNEEKKTTHDALQNVVRYAGRDKRAMFYLFVIRLFDVRNFLWNKFYWDVPIFCRWINDRIVLDLRNVWFDFW